METHETFKHFALYGVLISWILGLWLSYRTKHVDVKTTSELALTSRSNYFLFAIGVTLPGFFMAICTFGYMRQNLNIHDLYYYLYVLCLTLQLITAWIPDMKGYRHRIHYYAAWIMSHLLFSLGALLLVEVYQVGITRIYQYFGIIVLITMAFIGTYAGRVGVANKHFLRSQQLFFVLFQILLLSRIYS